MKQPTSFEDIFNNINFTLLRKQRDYLLALDPNENIDGIINFIDEILFVNNTYPCRMVVGCNDSNGVPDFLIFQVETNNEAYNHGYNHGKHYETAKEIAENLGYQPLMVIDEHDAGFDYFDISPYWSEAKTYSIEGEEL